MWGPFWRGNQVLVQCDNMAVVNAIASNTSKDGTMMHLLRGLHFICAFYNINIRASHIEVVKNVSADAISRNNLQVFFRENPTANRHPTRIPEPLWEILVTTQPDWLLEHWRRSLVSSLETAFRTAQGGATQRANQHT